MPMRPCGQGLENNWGFRAGDGDLVIATCKNCEREVSFMSRKARHRSNSRFSRHREKLAKPVTVVGENFQESPGFVDDGLPPW